MARLARGIMVPVVAVLLLSPGTARAQREPPLGPLLPDGPWVYETLVTHAFEQFEAGPRIRVSVVTRDLERPWSLAFLPDGTGLITEMQGRLRTLRDGNIHPDPVDGTPEVQGDGIAGLMDVAVHPRFSENHFIYLSYMKGGPRPEGWDPGYYATTALARGRLEENRLVDLEDIFVADAWSAGTGGAAARLAFGVDGKLYISSSHRNEIDLLQTLSSHFGKILRLNDDGSVPDDNPFLEDAGAAPGTYSWGHRTVLGLAVHPETGELWETENGPLGGDEVNVIRGGRNYAWPLVSFGQQYDGSPVSVRPTLDGMEDPILFWVPSITTSGLTFYDGDRFPLWKGSLFIGSMRVGRMPGTGHLQRVFFNENGEQGREMLLTDLKQRIRDVRQGPDGLLYVLTDEGALLKIEPFE